MTTTQPAQTKSKAFWLLLVLSFGYAAVFYFLGNQTSGCMVVTRETWPLFAFIQTFIERHFSCRTINELGDALAGAFAPIAFLWLAGAVFIQSKELQAQREELNETQEVMRLQLKATEQQVVETKASTALFRQQTAILEQQHLIRQSEVADQTLEGAENAFRATLSNASSLTVVVEKMFARTPRRDIIKRVTRSHSPKKPAWFQLPAGKEFYVTIKELKTFPHGKAVGDMTLAEICKQARDQAERAMDIIRESQYSKGTQFFEVHGWDDKRGVWLEALAGLKVMHELEPTLSKSARLELGASFLPHTIGAVEQLINALGGFEISAHSEIEQEKIKQILP